MIQSLSRCCFVQLVLLSICAAYPYILVPKIPSSSGIVKRSFDRIENGAFQFGSKRAFDRLDDSDFGLMKRSAIKRAFDRLDLADFGLRKKRAFDRLARSDFGFRRKRAFDRIGGSDFGLTKRSAPTEENDREALVDSLASSIVALRHAREESQTETPQDNIIVVEYDEQDEE